MLHRIRLTLGLAAVMAVAAAQSAFATAQDYSSLTSGFSAELTAILPIVLAAVGLFIGVIMAYRVGRKILHA